MPPSSKLREFPVTRDTVTTLKKLARRCNRPFLIKAHAKEQSSFDSMKMLCLLYDLFFFSFLMFRGNFSFLCCSCKRLIYSFIHPSIHSFTHSFVLSFVHSLIHPSIHLSIHLLTHSLTHSFIHLFIHSFIMQSLTLTLVTLVETLLRLSITCRL